jgi:hypothetical protein
MTYRPGATQVAEALPIPANQRKQEPKLQYSYLQHLNWQPNTLLTQIMQLGAPAPLALPCDLPRQYVLATSLILSEPLELCVLDTVVPWYLAIHTEKLTGAHTFCYRRIPETSVAGHSSTEQSLKGHDRRWWPSNRVLGRSIACGV